MDGWIGGRLGGVGEMEGRKRQYHSVTHIYLD